MLEQKCSCKNGLAPLGQFPLSFSPSIPPPEKEEKTENQKAEKEEKTEEKEEKRKPFHFHFYPHFFSKKGREVEKETDFFLLHFPLFSL